MVFIIMTFPQRQGLSSAVLYLQRGAEVLGVYVACSLSLDSCPLWGLCGPLTAGRYEFK